MTTCNELQFTDDSFSSTNSSRSASTVTQAAALNDAQSNDDEPALMRPVRTGRAKATCYVSIFYSYLSTVSSQFHDWDRNLSRYLYVNGCVKQN